MSTISHKCHVYRNFQNLRQKCHEFECPASPVEDDRPQIMGIMDVMEVLGGSRMSTIRLKWLEKFPKSEAKMSATDSGGLGVF